MIVILTALQVEHQAVLEHLTNVEVRKHAAGTLFEVGTLTAQPKRHVALGLTGPGNERAAALTERAIAEFSPSALMFVGVAGGLRPWLEIGDVVVATKVHAYHGGRSENDEFLVRPRSWEISHALEQVARRIPRGGTWHSLLPNTGEGATPEVHFEPVAAGEVVLNSTSSPLAQKIRRNFNDAIAIEMESSGFAHAAHLSGKVPMVTIRSISDHADGTKVTTDRQGGQRIAARNAAAFAIALAGAVDDDSDEHGRKQNSNPAPNPWPRLNNTNTARDNARVGQQIGFNLGDSHANWTGGDR
ncbi:5'-methylthioadenosine/S-adenosylhomocysteine nucleosidase family protein [Streptoalloteichus hindustanus]|uniref:Nucleoside phosphorylase n=1 Tax=Streptoalloteichus hindustanus TaxID=2017 RepID=A0A1M5N0A4_STRHI|nr:5'-methylthioadenosine/S-adenosylhomocysteine nucleosidase [Streptoalloteichus hindustanus]SHG82927.1 Nucleoside phosphorylase [Streptoalloteichus hindustanus]